MRETAKAFGLSLEQVRRILRKRAPDIIRPVGDTRNNSTRKNSNQRKN